MLYGTGTHSRATTPRQIQTKVRSTEELMRRPAYHAAAPTAARRNGVAHSGGPTFSSTIASDGITM